MRLVGLTLIHFQQSLNNAPNQATVPPRCQSRLTYTNEGGWFDVDKVRFRFGMPENWCGWEKFSNASYLEKRAAPLGGIR